MSFQDTINGVVDHGISSSDTGTYPALGFNPAPGNTGTVGSLAQNFLTVSGHLSHARDAMTKAGQAGGFWEGDAANAFHKDIGKLPDYLDEATRSLGDAGRALDGWANDLSSMQRTAADYERQAEAALRQVNQAKSNPDLNLAGKHFDTDQALAEAQQKLNAATSQLNSAENELNSIREQAKRLFSQHQDLVKQVEDALNKAKDEAPDKPGLFASIGNALSGALHGMEDLAKKTWGFVKDHADVIAKIGDVLSDIGTVLSIAAVCTAEIPIVGEVVEGVSIGVNGAALAAHGLAKAAGANVSYSTLAMDAMGMIPGGGALKGVTGGAKIARVVKAGAKGIQFGEDGAKLARGAEAAGKALTRVGEHTMGSWAHTASKIAKVVPGLSEKIGVDAVKVGEKTIYTATNTAGHVAGAAFGTAKGLAVQVGKWEAQPYLSNAENAGKDFASRLAHGQPLPSAGQVWHEVVHGSK